MRSFLIRTSQRTMAQASTPFNTTLSGLSTSAASASASARAARTTPRKYRSPNFFVGFRIANPEVIANISQLQDRIATQFPDVARCVIDVRTLHVTLVTLHLETEEDKHTAVRILDEHARSIHAAPFGDDAPTFDFRGVKFFGNNFILYSPLDVMSRYYDTLEALAERLHTAFDAVELTTGPYRKPYTPHLTVWKTTKFIRYVKELNKHRAVPIEVELGNYLKEAEPTYYGSEQPTTFELLSMREKEPDGYYKVYQSSRLVTTEHKIDEDEEKAMVTP